MMYNFRNPILTSDGRINVEIDHPVYGWVPCAVAADDPDTTDIYAAALTDGPAAYVPPPPQPITASEVNAERNRRLRAPFTFAGHAFDRDPTSLQRITGAATLAGFAMAAGAQAGNLFWHGGESPFAWIAADNSIVTMDAPTCFAFGQEAAAVETRLIFAARAVKAMDPIPADYADDIHWP